MDGTDHLEIAHPLKRKAAIIERQVIALAALVLIGAFQPNVEAYVICTHLHRLYKASTVGSHMINCTFMCGDEPNGYT